ncbi:MAG: hypothetical protein E7437_01525 [Ruminococcaceae bacterium]|nr:hypothetical protein [Oscillospiraceae bacterium]
MEQIKTILQQVAKNQRISMETLNTELDAAIADAIGSAFQSADSAAIEFWAELYRKNNRISIEDVILAVCELVMS